MSPGVARGTGRAIFGQCVSYPIYRSVLRPGDRGEVSARLPSGELAVPSLTWIPVEPRPAGLHQLRLRSAHDFEEQSGRLQGSTGQRLKITKYCQNVTILDLYNVCVLPSTGFESGLLE